MALLGARGVNLNLDHVIQGEWAFDISGGKSFIVSDDPTLTSSTIMFGVSNRVLVPGDIAGGVIISNSVGSNLGQFYVLVGDDGEVVQKISELQNGFGSSHDISSLSPIGVTTRDIEVQTLTVTTSRYNLNLDPGSLILTTDDPTLAAPTYIFALSRNNALLNTDMFIDQRMVNIANSIGVTSYFNSTDLFGASILSSRDSQISTSYANNYSSLYLGVSNGNVTSQISISEDSTSAPIALYASKGDISLTAIGSDTTNDINLTASNGNVSISVSQALNIIGKIKYQNYKTGTLASPPVNMQIGEVWADTTTSATHPMLRISTVTT